MSSVGKEVGGQMESLHTAGGKNCQYPKKLNI